MKFFYLFLIGWRYYKVGSVIVMCHPRRWALPFALTVSEAGGSTKVRLNRYIWIGIFCVTFRITAGYYKLNRGRQERT